KGSSIVVRKRACGFSAPLLALDHLSVSVRASDGRLRPILADACVEIMRGEVVAIDGPSGGGKSTLLKAVLGLTRFTHGRMVFDGNQIRRPLDAGHKRLRGAAEAVFQNPLGALNPHARLRTTIEEPLRAGGLSQLERRQRVERIAARMGLDPALLERRPAAVSLGQAQRACIARAIAPRPTLLVLDEPLSALDALVAAEVAGLLTDVIAETQPTVLFVSHDMRLVRRLASRVIVIEAGRIVEDAPADRLLSAPQSNAARALVDCDTHRRAAFAAARFVQREETVA
ncbi:MAG: ATP-binding cassette domain-containing protein, partial [Pseudomonadota bacterium]